MEQVGAFNLNLGEPSRKEVVASQRQTVLLVEGDLVGEDVEAAVELHGVGADHLHAGEVGREVDGQPRLAGASGAHNNNHLAPSPLRR